MAMMGTFVVAQGAVQYWHLQVQDPAAVTYVYDTPPGLVIVALRLVALGWFIAELWHTMKYYNALATGRCTYIQIGLHIPPLLSSLLHQCCIL